ncbi:MAG: BCCT family transporter [Actinomycetaceae bacterium]
MSDDQTRPNPTTGTPPGATPPQEGPPPDSASEEVPADVAADLSDDATRTVTLPGLPENLPETVALPDHYHIAEGDSDDQIARKLARHGIVLGRGSVYPRVFWPALIVVLVVAVVSILWPTKVGPAFSDAQAWLVANVGWFYMLSIGIFVGVAIFIGFSRLGRIRLGRDDEEPEYSTLSWFAMLFAAGMGIGLVFYGVGEPLTYATYMQKPGWDGSQAEINGLAMAQTFIHWGLHPWAIYAIIGLGVGYAIHRRGRPVSIRWALEPLFGDRVKGWAGDVIDVLAIFGTVFGVATSLGLGVNQISSGVQEIGLIDSYDNTFLVILIVVITFLATLSVISGLGAGIKILSNTNLSLAGLLLIAMLLIGPTVFIFQNFVESLGTYLANFFQMTFDVGAYQRSEEAQTWFSGWTIFYWGWWIAWSPFVGVFIARISKGRTIRQFIAGVLLVPTLVGFIWFSVLGGNGLFRQFYGEGDLLQPDGTVSTDGVLFQVLADYPLGTVFAVIGVILVAVFFITSSDSGSLVVDMLASGGHPNPPRWSRVLWAVLEGMIAAALLLAGGKDGLESLQAASLMTALPFVVILLLMAWANIRALTVDAWVLEREERMRVLDNASDHITAELTSKLDEYPELARYVDDRIDYRITRSARGPIGRAVSRSDDEHGTERAARTARRSPRSDRRRREKDTE